MKYKKEIDGLRAIAVLSVVIYHLDIYIYGHKLLRGGFLGVDIFFVISGYLISSILIKNDINSNFSITNFYLRRSRRILPAFFFMTFVILISSIIIVSQSDLKEIINSKISSIFFVSNFFFYFSSLDYGGLDSLLKPFLHTWTLSVEEQFYLFFPFFFIFFSQKKRNIYIYLIFLFSFCFSNFAFRYFPNLNFYLIFSRAWELFFGYIILINQNKIYAFFSKKRSKQIISFISLISILFSLIFFYEEKLHPSIFTLFIILSTGLLIIFSMENKIISFILSNKLIVFIGLISYSLYLWHYPILALFRYKLIEFTSYHKMIALVLIFLISIFSYYFIEKKYRNKTVTFKKLASFIFSILLINTIIIYIFFNFYNKTFFNQKIILDNNYLLSLRKSNYKRGWEYFDQYRSDKKNNIMVLGDSHRFDFHQILNASNFTDQYNIFQCTIRLVYFETDKTKYEYRLAKEKGWIRQTQNCIEKIKIKKYEKIIITYSFTEKHYDYLNSFLKYLKTIGYNNEIILTSRFLSFKFEEKGKTYLDRLITKKNMKFDKKRDERKMYEKISLSDFKINKKLKDLANLYKIQFIDKTQLQCDFDKENCYIITDLNEKIYVDESPHLTLEGAKFFSKNISNILILE